MLDKFFWLFPKNVWVMVITSMLYSSIPLVNALESRLTCFVGTVDKRRRQLPREVRARSVKLRRGDIKAWRDGNKLCVAWRDKGKPTLMMRAQ